MGCGRGRGRGCVQGAFAALSARVLERDDIDPHGVGLGARESSKTKTVVIEVRATTLFKDSHWESLRMKKFSAAVGQAGQYVEQAEEVPDDSP